MKSTCPACGAEVVFRSSISVSAVCPYCDSLLLRRGQDLEDMGKVAKLPEDMSLIQIGSSGKYQGSNFQIVGRLRVGWSDGFWNEWYALFDDGREGWLAEAQGNFMMTFRVETPKDLWPVAKMYPGAKVKIGKETLSVTDTKKCVCVGAEGELPILAAKGRESTSVDLQYGDSFGTIEYAGDETRVFVGAYVELDAMKMMNLRELHGW